MADLRTCRIEGCPNKHPRNLFCCRDHWRRLPADLRKAIWATYRNGQGVFEADYLQACENAEAYLEDREARDMSNVLDE